MSRHASRGLPLSSWIAVDWIVAAYTLGVALLALVAAAGVPAWRMIVASHAGLLAVLAWLPPRGAPWEHAHLEDPRWLRSMRYVGRFLRYTYPALLLTPFFEEVTFTVHATSAGRPYWFEPYLYGADRALFGATPAVALARVSTPFLDELMHAFYLSYYPLIIGGIVIAWIGPRRPSPRPPPSFHTVMTAMMLGFVFAYVWYPFLPARGPWENHELMATLPQFGGLVFTPLARGLIDQVGVSGGCFPSAHLSGTWGVIVGLTSAHRRPAAWFALVATGLGVACVYTRYHHVVDVFAGFAAGVAGGALGLVLTRRSRLRAVVGSGL